MASPFQRKILWEIALNFIDKDNSVGCCLSRVRFDDIVCGKRENREASYPVDSR